MTSTSGCSHLRDTQLWHYTPVILSYACTCTVSLVVLDGHASLKSDQQAVLADAYAKLQKRVHNGK
jgi:hypothetical protein